jgi:uncharacterized membrane protein YeiH
MPVSTLTLVLDLCGVFVFALSGALAAVLRKLDVVGVAVVATVSAIGGGLLRDVLLREIPLVLRTGELYAITALAGAVLVAVADQVGAYNAGTAGAAVAVVFALRVLALRRNWSAPLPRGVEGS